MINQKTIKKSIELNGVGLHNGIKADITIKPADINHGIKFKRIDLKNNNVIEANFKNVNEPILCTKIKNSNGVSVSTIEHLMAAFYLEGVDNVLVEINAPEVPILDGSAFDFVEAIRTYGTEEQSSPKKFIKVLKKIEIKDGPKFISIEPLDKDLIIDFEIVYKNPLIRTRRKKFKLSDGDFASIYNSRTFCLYEDIENLRNMGFAKGGSLNNAVVVKDNELLNKEGLRNNLEFVNHKILDCMGDLYLAGFKIIGSIKCSQGGHSLTNQLLRKVFKDKSNYSIFEIKEKSIPHTYINKLPLKSIA